MEIFRLEFMQNAIYAALLASLTCGVIGSLVVIKRLVSIAGGIAHTAFGGIGLGFFLGINPIYGLIPVSLLSAVGIGLISRKQQASEDSLIGIFWSVGMATGIILIGLTPGYVPDLFSYLFGNILTVPMSDIWLMLGLNIFIFTTVFLFYKELLAVCFDEEGAEVLGVKTKVLYLLLLCLVAITIVILVRVVGIILVIALLTIPASIAKQYTRSLKKMMLLAAILGAVFTLGGLWLSYLLDWASGATIILFAGSGFLFSLFSQRIIRRAKLSS